MLPLTKCLWYLDHPRCVHCKPGKNLFKSRWMSEGNQGWQLQTIKYDLMRDYRHTIPTEQQEQIWSEVKKVETLPLTLLLSLTHRLNFFLL